MLLRNATDKKTEKLTQFGLNEMSIEINGVLVPPGGTALIPEELTEHMEKVHKHLFDVGALGWAKSEEPAPSSMATLPASVPADPPSLEEELKNALVDMKDKNKRK